MERHPPSGQTRRAFLRVFGVIPAALGLASGGQHNAMAQGRTLPPTPACADRDDATPAQTEGPYYKRSSPQRTSLLEPGITCTQIVITGFVFATNCQPVAQALIDFWQADAQGVYD